MREGVRVGVDGVARGEGDALGDTGEDFGWGGCADCARDVGGEAAGGNCTDEEESTSDERAVRAYREGREAREAREDRLPPSILD